MPVLRDGFRAQISMPLLAGQGGIQYHEVTIKLPTVDGRGGIDQSSMRNTWLTTQLPKALITLGEITGSMMYSTEFYFAAMTTINRNQNMTLLLPDGSTFSFWGWLNQIDPTEYKEGERPLLNFNIQLSNLNTQCQEAPPSFNIGSLTPCQRV